MIGTIANGTKTVTEYDFNLGSWLVKPYDSVTYPKFYKATITPEFAKDVLAQRNKKNRTLKKHRIKKFVTDINDGNWIVTNQGIGFDVDGILSDGQNRLAAIAEAGKPVQVMVGFGLSVEAKNVIDDVKPRSDYDRGTLAGQDVSKNKISALNYILEYRLTDYSKQQKLDFYSTYLPSAEWAVNQLSEKFLRKGPIMAVFARAYHALQNDSTQLARLEELCEILRTGQGVKGREDKIAIGFRDWVMQSGRNLKGPGRKVLYRKTEWVVDKFLKYVPVEKLMQIAEGEELFPLPCDADQTV